MANDDLTNLKDSRDLLREMNIEMDRYNDGIKDASTLQGKLTKDAEKNLKSAIKGREIGNLTAKGLSDIVKLTTRIQSEQIDITESRRIQLDLEKKISVAAKNGQTKALKSMKFQKLLLVDMDTRLEAEKSSVEAKEQAEKATEKTNQLQSTSQDLLSGGATEAVNMGKGLMEAGKAAGPIGVAVAAAVMVAIAFSAKLDAIGEQFGAIGLQSKEMTSNLMATEQEAAKLGFEMKDVLTASSQLTDNFAISLSDSIALSGEVLDMSKALGICTEEAGTLIGQFKTLLGSTAEQSIALAKNVTLLAKANDVAPQQVLRDMADASEAIAKFTDKTGENMARAAIQARKFGQSLSDVASQAEGLLDFQSSITKSMEASVLIGKNINNQKLMELSLSGDLEGFQKEQLKQLKNIGFAELDNVLAKTAAAEALGLSVDQAQKMVNLTEEAVSLSGELAGQPGFDDLVGKEGISTLSQMNNQFKSMAATLVNSLGPAINLILKVLNIVLSLGQFIHELLSGPLLRLISGQDVNYGATVGKAGSQLASSVGLADGGIVTDRVDNVTMGEAGPEAVVPLDKFMTEFRTLKTEMAGVKDAILSLKLTTKITNRDLNITLTPSKTG